MGKLKRLICIVLVLICLCMQGCSWEEMAERAKERRVSKVKKYIQEHKQIADGFVSEDTEYTFVMKLKSEFIDNDDAISKGYIKVERGEFLKDGNNPSNYSIYSVNVNPIYKNEELVGRKFSLWNKTTEERKIITIDITDEKSHFAFFSLRKAYNFLDDGKIFLVTYTDEPEMLSSFHYNKKRYV